MDKKTLGIYFVLLLIIIVGLTVAFIFSRSQNEGEEDGRLGGFPSIEDRTQDRQGLRPPSVPPRQDDRIVDGAALSPVVTPLIPVLPDPNSIPPLPPPPLLGSGGGNSIEVSRGETTPSSTNGGLSGQTYSLAKKPLTDEEVFDAVWPPEYREALKDLENLSIVFTLEAHDHGEGEELVIKTDDFVLEDKQLKVTNETDLSRRLARVLPIETATDEEPPFDELIYTWVVPDEAKTGELKTDEDIYRSLLTIFNQAYKEGLITKEELENFSRGVTEVLPDIIEQERRALSTGQGPSGFTLPRDQRITQSMEFKDTVYRLLDGLAYVFGLVEPAEAAWVRGADCYKDDAPGNAAPGFNGATFCCNCGIHFHHCSKCAIWPHFHNDCGVDGSGCDIQLGCLNLVCGGTPNAIWDSSTGICGCG